LRAPPDTIPAPPFPVHLRWLNTRRPLFMNRLQGRPVLIEFWDHLTPNSLRTLPYTQAWHERYRGDGLQVVGVHSPSCAAAGERAAVEAALARLGLTYPVLLDPDMEVWREYENRGWPARYLFDGRGYLFEYHYGEGAYRETELAIRHLLGVEREPLGQLGSHDTWSVSRGAGDTWSVPPQRTYRALLGASSECSRVSSSRRTTGGPSSSTTTQHPGQ